MILNEEAVTAILAPIGDGNGIGGDGREDEDAIGDLFRELRFQRKAVFKAEQRAAMGEDSGDGDNWSWGQLGEVARDYLIETSKDLEAMAIVVEASTRIDGVPGLALAMDTLSRLVEEYWDYSLYPPEDEEDGVEARFQPLSGLSGGSGDKEGTLIMPLRRMVLGGDPVTGELRYLDRVTADAQFAQAQGGGENKAQLASEAEQALAAIEALARRLSARAVKANIERLEAAETAWRGAINFISARTKPRFPAASRVSDELRNMREWLSGLLKVMPDDSASEIADSVGDGAAGEDGAGFAVGGAPGGPMVLGRIGSRADALRAVTAAAEYFERFEPHAPYGATLREVDRRARLSLADLLEELIPDSDTRETFYWRSGIKPPAPAEAADY